MLIQFLKHMLKVELTTMTYCIKRVVEHIERTTFPIVRFHYLRNVLGGVNWSRD
jgi:hypothetical protein